MSFVDLWRRLGQELPELKKLQVVAALPDVPLLLPVYERHFLERRGIRGEADVHVVQLESPRPLVCLDEQFQKNELWVDQEGVEEGVYGEGYGKKPWRF